MSYYKCPACGLASRDTEKTTNDGKLIVRKIVYECGTVLRLIQDGMSYKHRIEPSTKCLERNITY